MRVLIYGEGEAAIERRDQLRREKHHASLRNPEFFNPEQFERAADLVISDDETVLEAYQNLGINTQILTIQTETQLPDEDWADEEPGSDEDHEATGPARDSLSNRREPSGALGVTAVETGVAASQRLTDDGPEGGIRPRRRLR